MVVVYLLPCILLWSNKSASEIYSWVSYLNIVHQNTYGQKGIRKTSHENTTLLEVITARSAAWIR